MDHKTHYIDKILEKFNKSDSNVIRTPIDVNLHLSKNGKENISQLKYSVISEFDVLDELYKAQYSLLSEQTEQVYK